MFPTFVNPVSDPLEFLGRLPLAARRPGEHLPRGSVLRERRIFDRPDRLRPKRCGGEDQVLGGEPQAWTGPRLECSCGAGCASKRRSALLDGDRPGRVANRGSPKASGLLIPSPGNPAVDYFDILPATAARAGDVSLYNSLGKPVAYIDMDENMTIYLCAIYARR